MEGMPKVLILGIGNLLWADEGFGVRAVEALNRTHVFEPNVTLMDGGTQGLHLVEHVRGADILVVFDAIDYGLAPGALRLILDGDVPKFLGAKKLSLHQTGFQDVLALAEILGGLPRHILLAGVQPRELEDYGGSLRDAVKAQIVPAIDHALAYLARFGVAGTPRAAPLPESVTLSSPEVALGCYEAGRPSEKAAFRLGDPRVVFAEAPVRAPDRSAPESG